MSLERRFDFEVERTGQCSFFPSLETEYIPHLHALVVRQPWADLIVGTVDDEGRRLLRPVEFRLWQPKKDILFPFQMAVIASGTYTRDELQVSKRLKVVPSEKGAIIGTVWVEKVKRVWPNDWSELKDVSFENGEMPGNVIYAWHLINQHRFKKPVPYRGRLGLMRIEATSEITKQMNLISTE